MNYIILDLEWNQSENNAPIPEIPFEIIEIGAVKLDENRKYIDSFHRVIAPALYTNIHYVTMNLTGLTNEKLRSLGKSFPEAAGEFMEWCGRDYLFCTWGMMDITELQRNLSYYKLPLLPFPVIYYDLQKIFSLSFEAPKLRRSLEYAVDFLRIPTAQPFHRAICDAKYTAEIFLRLDLDLAKANYSIDTYLLPASKRQEIYACFEDYAKYISRGFEDKLKVMADRNVTATVCFRCGRKLRKKVRWFSGNAKNYYCLCLCPEHGFLKGRIRIKRHDSGQYFAIRTLKLTDDDGAKKIYDKQNEIRKKRREKRHARAEASD